MNKTANFDLTGKVAIITGSSKGIGEAMARAMAARSSRSSSSSERHSAAAAASTCWLSL